MAKIAKMVKNGREMTENDYKKLSEIVEIDGKWSKTIKNDRKWL
jgi:hypothetical protein